jgi:hypothetical protein
MWKTFYANMPSTTLPLFAMGLFIGFFVLMVLRVYAGKRAVDFAGLAQLPLADSSSPTESHSKPSFVSEVK